MAHQIRVLSNILVLAATQQCPDADCATSIGLLQVQVNFSASDRLHQNVTVSVHEPNQSKSQEGMTVDQGHSTLVLSDVQSSDSQHDINYKSHCKLHGIYAHPIAFWNSLLLVIGMVSLMLHLLPLLANMRSSEQAAEKAGAKQADSSTWKAAPVVCYGGLYILCSCTLIKYNKYLMTEGRFPFAVNLTLGHQASGSVFLFFLYKRRPSLFPSLAGSGDSGIINRGTFVRGVLPIAICFSGSLVLFNVAYMFTSVAFLQMMKQGNVLLVYTLSLIAGLEVFHSVRARALFCLTLSTALTLQGQLEFSMAGFLVQGASQVLEAMKLVLQSLLLSAAGSGHLDAYSYNLMVQPTTAVLLVGFLWVCIGFIPHVAVASLADYVAWGPQLMANCGVALALNILISIVVAHTSAIGFITVSIIKDVTLVFFDVLISGTQISNLQVIAFVLQVLFVACYGFLKTFAKQLEPESSKT